MLSAGSGHVMGRAHLGAIFLAGLFACVGIAGLQVRTAERAPTMCPLHRHVGTIGRQSPPLSPAQRQQLLAERARLGRDENDMLKIVRLEIQLTDCAYARAILKQQIVCLEKEQ